jgi:hypothetical protein
VSRPAGLMLRGAANEQAVRYFAQLMTPTSPSCKPGGFRNHGVYRWLYRFALLFGACIQQGFNKGFIAWIACFCKALNGGERRYGPEWHTSVGG